MRLNRILAILLAATLLAGLTLPAAAAENGATVALSSGVVAAGDEVTLTVSISDNPGMATYLIYIYYDTSVFSVNTSSDIYATGVFRTGGVVTNDIATAKANGRYFGDESKDGVLALWYNGSGLNTSGDGEMLTITLTAKDSAASGSYAVELGYSQSDTCNEDGEKVRLELGSTTVTVTGTGQASDTTPENPPEPGDDSADGPGSNGGAGHDDAQTPTDSPSATPSNPTTGKTEDETVDETPSFTDVTNHWAERYINRAAAMGLIKGYAGLCRPDDTMTRAECVTILWRASGEPKASKPASFTDLEQDWYREAVAWAEENKVINGIGNNLFDPNGTVTREQLAAILHRQAGSPSGMEVMLTGLYDLSYTDSAQISDWAKASLYWSVYNIIYCGENSVDVIGTLSPGAAASRAQIAVMIVRYLEQR